MSRNRELAIALILGVVFVGALLLGLRGSAAQAQVANLPAMPQAQASALPAAPIKGVAAAQTFTPAWATERVDAEKTFGFLTDRSLALDSANRPHIAYGTDHLYYAWHDGSKWNYETVDPAWGVGRYASIALDSSDKPHISYYDDINGDLKYAYRSGFEWIIQVVDSSGDVGESTSLTLDSLDRPHIAYLDRTNGNLKYAEFTGSGWGIQTADGSGGALGYISLALDSSDRPHISYYWRIWPNPQALRYAHWTGSVWIMQTVHSGSAVGQYTSLALDSSDRPHISYLDGGNTDLVYARWTGSTWITATVDGTVGWGSVYTSIALDASVNPRIVYRNSTNSNLTYARWTGSTWITETIVNGGGVPSLALDNSSNPHVSYLLGEELRYARWTGSAWNSETVDIGRFIGSYASLALAPTAPYTPHISYGAGGTLRHAYYSGSAWVITTVENVIVNGTALALEPTAPYTPHIAYYASTDGKITHAYWTGSAWVTQTVDSPGERGWGISLALAPAPPHEPHIAYLADGGNLKYARWMGSGWSIETVDFRTDSFKKLESPSLALAATSPYTSQLSYHNTHNGDLKYARRTGTGWVIESVGNTGNTSEPISLALDSSGRPRIAYIYWDELKYLRWMGSAWVIETVDSNGVCCSASLALDSADRPRIAYYNGDSHLGYTHHDGTQWITETVDGLGNVGLEAWLALDGEDRPRIAYHDYTNGDLKFAWQVRVDVVPTTGGTFGAFGSAAFEFPAGAVTDTVVLSYTILQPSSVLPHAGVFFDISAVYADTGQPAHIAPGQTYTVVVHYDEANVPAYVNEADLALYYWDSSSAQWVKEPTSIVDTVNNTITATPNHFSVWAVLGEAQRVFLPVVLRNY